MTEFLLTITATGEVRDEHGQLIEQKLFDATAVLTEEQAAALIEQQEEQQ